MDKVNIVLVEDEQEKATLLEETIDALGYMVMKTTDPKEALKFLAEMPVAVLITEARSSKMNGVEMTRAAAKVSPDTNVVVLTFYTLIKFAIEAMAEGAYGYITKPLNEVEIRVVVNRAVERYVLMTTAGDKEYYAQLAVKDGLTGLYNRRSFEQMITMQFSYLERHEIPFSLLMIDIDNFKRYNDTNGHPAGDSLLKKAAEVFRNSVRDSDSVCRYGGEEFVIMLPQADKRIAQLIAERIRVQASVYLPATVSIGLAAFPDDAKDQHAIVKKADEALYAAKQTGKNKVCAA
jgi:diguanylate cyclase (GGDEF)-like protein